MKTKHTAKRIAKGHYTYRGFTIKSFDQKYLLDPELQAVVWSIYGAGEDSTALEIVDSLRDAKFFVDQLVDALETNDRLTAEALSTPLANDDFGREYWLAKLQPTYV